MGEDHGVRSEQDGRLQNQQRLHRRRNVGADRHDSPTEWSILGIQVDGHRVLTRGVVDDPAKKLRGCLGIGQRRENRLVAAIAQMNLAEGRVKRGDS